MIEEKASKLHEDLELLKLNQQNIICILHDLNKRIDFIQGKIVSMHGDQKEFSYKGDCQNQAINNLHKSLDFIQGKIVSMHGDQKEFAYKGDCQNQAINDLHKSLSFIQGKIVSMHKEQRELAYKNNIGIIDKKLSTIISFCQNQTIDKNVLNKNETVLFLNLIHKLISLKAIKTEGVELLRVGRKNDGGYVMLKPMSRKKIAYSVGISDDVSWDKDMAGLGYEIYQYDHTIEKLPEENSSFYWKKRGLGGIREGLLITLRDMIEENGHFGKKGMVLKIDIEGSEWDVISSCSEEDLEHFDQIAIEMHDFINSDRKKVIAALEMLNKNHVPIHVHGNNYDYGVFHGNKITPNVIEVTYVKKELYEYAEYDNSLPLQIDDSNRQNDLDYLLGNW